MNDTLRKAQEERFIKWVESRDDDWWEDQARIDIWDFRVMQEFFMEDFTQHQERVIELLEREKMENTKDECTSDWFYGYGNNHAIDKAIKIVRES